MGRATSPVVQLGPQRGTPQEAFLTSPADVVIYGGAAGGGKTYGALLEPLRHCIGERQIPGFSAVYFRRTEPQISAPGGLWDEAVKIYAPLGASFKSNPPRQVTFRREGDHGAPPVIQFRHMQHVKNRLDWKGAQIPLIIFDQLEEFTAEQFWYLTTRNRSTCGVAPYIRATVNPDADSWVADLIQWWWDPETGLPIPERSGVLRWYTRSGDTLIWGDTREECIANVQKMEPHRKKILPKSLTFIPAKLSDNRILETIDPGYRANLEAMTRVDRSRLLDGNWKIRAAAGLVFNRSDFDIVDGAPAFGRRVRGWDQGATPGAGDFTSGVLVTESRDPTRKHRWYIEHVERGQWGTEERMRVMRQTAELDRQNYGDVATWFEIEGGSSGKDMERFTIKYLAGFDVHGERPTGDKLTRAKPAAAQASAGNIAVVRGDWNKVFLDNLHNFTGEDGGRDDDVDGFSLAFNRLTLDADYFDEVDLPELRREAESAWVT